MHHQARQDSTTPAKTAKRWRGVNRTVVFATLTDEERARLLELIQGKPGARR
jgi:hypothetical protein